MELQIRQQKREGEGDGYHKFSRKEERRIMEKVSSNFDHKICLADNREISVEFVRDRTSGAKGFFRIMEAYCRRFRSVISENR